VQLVLCLLRPVGWVSTYSFLFAEGTRLEDVPRAYVEFLLKRGAWKNRPGLWRALHSMGLVSEDPPPKIDQQNLQSSSTRQNMPTSNIATEASNSGELNLDHRKTQPQSSMPQDTQISNGRVELSRSKDLKQDNQTKTPRCTVHHLTTTSDNKTEVSRKEEESKLDDEAVRTQATPARKVGKSRVDVVKKKEAVVNKEGLKVDYTFDFGMHTGKAWAAVPEGYREWILEKKVYGSKGRENLLVALVQAGFDPSQ
jgi:hypothetical protein